MSWTNKYLDIPFLNKGRTEAGVDCWGLVVLVYWNELGVPLPSYTANYGSVSHGRAIHRLIFNSIRTGIWERVSNPREFDIVVLREGSILWHTGIYVSGNRLFHIERHAAYPCVERIMSVPIKHRVAGFFRYVCP